MLHIGGSLGLLGVVTIFGAFYGLFAVTWYLLDNKATGPMIEWFPGTMGKAVSALIVPVTLAIFQWIFFKKFRQSENQTLPDLQYLVLVSAIGFLIDGCITSVLLIFIFPTAWIFGEALHNSFWGALFGAFFGGLQGAISEGYLNSLSIFGRKCAVFRGSTYLSMFEFF